jgi:GxxExxY protein
MIRGRFGFWKGECMEQGDEALDEKYPEHELTGKILQCAFAVHNSLGAGFLEKVYANALFTEIRDNGLSCVREAPLQVRYKGNVVGEYVADLIVESRILLELKACAAIDANHSAQILNYLKASGIGVGLLLNFGRPRLEYRRFVN